jgi:lysophospholipase L1-like esterase
LRGRMLAGENAFFPHRDWLHQFPGILWSHLPLEVIIFFLWTNDCNAWSTKTQQDIHASLTSYAQIIDDWVAFLGVASPKVLLISPPVVQEAYLSAMSPVLPSIFLWAAKKSQQLSSIYASWAESKWWDFFDANLVVSASSLDGIHIDEQGHEILAKHLAAYLLSF